METFGTASLGKYSLFGRAKYSRVEDQILVWGPNPDKSESVQGIQGPGKQWLSKIWRSSIYLYCKDGDTRGKFSFSDFCINYILILIYITSFFSHSVVSDCLWPRGLKHTRFPRASSNSCPLSQWCHPTILSSVIPSPPAFNLPALGSFLMSWLFVSGGQTIRASASVLPMNIQDWFPLGLTGLISLQSKGLSRVFSNSTVQKHQFFDTQPSLWYNSHTHTWLLEKP